MSTFHVITIIILFYAQRMSLSSPCELEIAVVFNYMEGSPLLDVKTTIYNLTSVPVYVYFFQDKESLINEYSGSQGAVPRSKVIIDIRAVNDDVLCHFAHLNDILYIVMPSKHHGSCKAIHLHTTPYDHIHTAFQVFEYGEDISQDVFIFTELDLDTNEINTEGLLMPELVIYNLTYVQIKYLSNLLSDKFIQRFILLGSYEVLQITANQVKVAENSSDDQIIMIPTNTVNCPYFPAVFLCFKDHHFNQKYKDTKQYFENIVMILNSSIIPLVTKSEECQIKNSKENLDLVSQAIRDYTQENITIHRDDHVSSFMIGWWSYTYGLQWTYKPFTKLPPVRLSVTLLHEPPFVNRIYTESGVKYNGYTVDVWEAIAQRLNVKYTYREPVDGQYGASLPDGTWTGAVGEVASGVTDIAAGAISVTAERDTVVDFSTPYFDYAGLQILMKRPDTTVPLFVFTLIFSEYAWATWFSILILTGFLIYFFHRWLYKTFAKNVVPKPINLFNLKDSFWFVTASIALAGPERSPVSFSNRLLVAGFWFFCELVMASYTANLAAFLTASRLVTSIASLEDLASQNVVNYSVIAGSAGETYFKRMANIEDNFYSLWRDMSYASSPESTVTKYAVWDYPLGDKYMRLWKSMTFVKDSKEGLSKVLAGDFVFFQETPVLEYDMMRHCSLTTVGKPFSAKPYAFVLPQGSALVKQVSNAILELQSETFLTTLKTKWWKNGTTPCPIRDDSSGLGLETLGGIFIVMLIGCGLGVITLILECLFAQYLISKRKSQSRNFNNISSNGRAEPCTSKSSFGGEVYGLNEVIK